MLDQMILERIARENRCRIENDDALTPGYQLSNGKYEICHVMYSSDNGFVYMGRDNYTKNCVAIKEFYPRDTIEYNNEVIKLKRNKQNQALQLEPFTPNKYEEYMNLLNRFFQEAERLKELSMNRYVIDVNDCFEANNSGYIVLEYIDYPTLSQLMASDEPIAPRDIADIYMLILKAVEEIHRAGMIHRDIKPSNIFVMADKVVIGDFGISKYQRDISKTHTISYTDNYASPEQKQGASTQGTWSDIYSLGKILKYLIIHLGYKNSIHIKSRQEAYESGLQLVDKAIAKDIVEEIIHRACKESISQRLQNIHEIQNILSKNLDPSAIKKIIPLSLVFIFIGILLFLSLENKDDKHINTIKEHSTPIEGSREDSSKAEHLNITNDSKERRQINKEASRVEVKAEEVNANDSTIKVSESMDRITFKTPENSTYTYTGAKIVEWTNPHDLPGYHVSIINTTTWNIETPQFFVHGTSLNLDNLGLNPSTYRLILFVTGPNKEYSYLEYFNFSIEEPTEGLLSPVTVDTDFYSYHRSDDKFILFYPQDEFTSYQVSLLDYNGAMQIATKEITEQGVNINDLYNKSGYHALIIQAKKEQRLSAYTKVDISIVEDDMPRRATFNIRNNAIFSYYSEKTLEWRNMDEPTEIYMQLLNVVSGQTIKESFNGDVKYYDLDSYGLSMGTYECTLSYLAKNTMSPTTRIHFAVLPPYLPSVVMDKALKREWALSESKTLTWSPRENANQYIINFYGMDSQEITAGIVTEKTFIDFTDTLKKGSYRVEIHYIDHRDNPSEKTIFQMNIN